MAEEGFGGLFFAEVNRTGSGQGVRVNVEKFQRIVEGHIDYFVGGGEL